MSMQNYRAGTVANEQLHIQSLSLYPTRDFHDQWRRSYSLQLTGATEDALYKMVSQYGPDKAFSNAGISQVNAMTGGVGGVGAPGMAAGGILRYSAQPTANAGIANGWASKRMRFEMVVLTVKSGVPSYREIIVGYTDYYGCSNLNGRAVLDPNMVYTIDSIVREPIEMVAGVAGMQAVNQVGSADVIVTNQSPIDNPFTAAPGTQQYVMRPQDVFVVADSLEIINGGMAENNYMTQNGMMSVNNNTYISDINLNHMAKPSNRRNDLINSYTSRLLTNMYQTSVIQASPAADDFLSPQSQAMLRVQEAAMSGYGFPFCITRIAGGTCSTTGQFTHAELLRLDATVDDRITVFSMGEDNTQLQIPPTAHMAVASSTTNQSIIASMISNTTLALMNTHGFMKISFQLDNFTGSPRCIVDAGVGPGEANRGALTSSFENSMVLEVASIISASDVGSYKINVVAEAFNIVHVRVRINGEIQETPYVFPGWASSANTPIVSNNFDQVSGLATSINQIVAGVTGNIGRQITSAVPGSGIIPGNMPAAVPQILSATGLPINTQRSQGFSQPSFQNAPAPGSSVEW